MTEIDDSQFLENLQHSSNDSNVPNRQPKGELTPFIVLVICLGLFVGGNLVGSALMLALAQTEGLDFQAVMKSLSENSPIGTRNFMRVIMLINHLFSFIIPSLVAGWIAYKNNIFKYLRLTKKPTMAQLVWGFVWLMVSMPFVQFAYQLNKMLPLPSWMIEMENSTGSILEAIITKENSYEIFINVLLIGVIPAIGEELMFRGLIQQQFERLVKNEHLTVWLAAAFFSAIHMQFQGFFARMILGALLGYLLIWTRSLWVPMLVHFLNNGLQVISIYAMNIKPSEMDKIEQGDQIHWTIGLAFMILSIGLGHYIHDKHSYKVENLQKE